MRVVDYDPTWPEAFRAVRDELRGFLRSEEVAIHHVGSTSVPGLAAKPVIDVLIEAPSLDVIDGASAALSDGGFEPRGEYGIAGRRYFVRPEGPGPRVHVHGFAAGHAQIDMHLLFRDYLRAHPAEAARYGDLKKTLAETHALDKDAYQDAKATFVEAIHRAASQWRAHSRPRAEPEADVEAQDEATASRLERLAEIEARIDPSLRRRGRIIADLVTIGLVTPLAVSFDFHVTRPFLMLALLGGALALNHLVPLVTERRLRAERTRLLAESGRPPG